VRVHAVKLGVLSALVAAVVTQTAPAHELAASVLAPEGSPGPVASSAATPPDLGPLPAVPDAWSFDDAHGAVSPTVAATLSTATRTRRPVAPRKPPRPPARAASGAMPAAGSPQAVLAAAYVKAVARAPKGCHLRVAHLAAIGQVESGSVGGRSIDGDHRVTPAIYGPLLDGGPFAVVHDSDGGAYDGAGDYDRAVGPLQFLPGTWRWAGRDGDGDGRRDPQNVFDAALATADYLCRDGRDLSRTRDLRAAILTYNWSGEYVAAVSQWISFFTRHGLAPLDDVAFRVGSGGRASSMAVAEPAEDKEPEKPEKPVKASPSPTTRPAGTPTSEPASTSSSTATGATTPTPSATTTVPGPDPTTPEPTTPDPTTTAPPAPTATTPSPTTPAPESTTSAPAERSVASTSSTD
jgi:membrane-bound lytic murein transglycosylase B